MNELYTKFWNRAKIVLTEDQKDEIINNLNARIGPDIKNLSKATEISEEITYKRDELHALLNAVHNEVPAKLLTVMEKAQLNSKHIESLKDKSERLKKKTEEFLAKHKPMLAELDKKFTTITKLEDVVAYFKSYAKVEDLSNQLRQCKDEEQMVNLYRQLTAMCTDCHNHHLSAYIKEYIQYWHNVLKEHLTKNYEDVLKTMKWPFSSADNPQIPSEVLLKFSNLTKNLLLIQEPYVIGHDINIQEDLNQVFEPCLPIKILLRPLKKRFIFHFTGTRQTARIDRPEWFLTQTLTWIRDHQKFIHTHVQPVADRLQLKNVQAVEEFNSGLISLAAERLHNVLALYQTQGAKGEIEDVDAAFAHTVDETLGFHKELCAITGYTTHNMLSVLTKAETFLRWLDVEKKYALSKMDETLDSEQWVEPVAAGVGAAAGAVLWVPRGADWLISLLKTMEERYFILPQPGHRLQFLELQLDLLDEWRMRLTQLLTAAVAALRPDTFLVAAPNLVIGIINTAHYVRSILLQWSHSLEYLQLHYYRSQFVNFTQQQHRDDSESSGDEHDSDEKDQDREDSIDETMYLKDLEPRAKKLAVDELVRKFSTLRTDNGDDEFSLNNKADNRKKKQAIDEGGAFGEGPELLAALRDAGLQAVVEHMMFEFKATIRDYKKVKWHSLPLVEERALCVSGALCGPLAALCARRAAAAAALAPPLAEALRALLARHVDDLLFEELCLTHYFNTGGTMQFTYDVTRNLVLAFSPPEDAPVCDLPGYDNLPRLLEGCMILNMEYADACRLRSMLTRQVHPTELELRKQHVTHLKLSEVLQILKNRTDLQEHAPESVMELF